MEELIGNCTLPGYSCHEPLTSSRVKKSRRRRKKKALAGRPFGGPWKIQISFKFPGHRIRISMHQNSNRLWSNDRILLKIIRHQMWLSIYSSFVFLYWMCELRDGRNWRHPAVKPQLLKEWLRWKNTLEKKLLILIQIISQRDTWGSKVSHGRTGHIGWQSGVTVSDSWKEFTWGKSSSEKHLESHEVGKRLVIFDKYQLYQF